MEAAQQHVAQQELCTAGINGNGEQHRVQKVEAQLMHINAISQSQNPYPAMIGSEVWKA